MPPVRLLDAKTTQLVGYDDLTKDDNDNPTPYPPYAILSHRWRGREVVFKDLNGWNPVAVKDLPDSPSRTKLLKACEQAQRRSPSINYLWADTVCIDKSDSPELQEAMNSMFKYYGKAEVCYAFLDDVLVSTGLSKSTNEKRAGKPSEWFERGWTLQELLAPRTMEFYDQSWQRMGTKAELAGQIGAITQIASDYLTNQSLVPKASIATKMSWMAGRITGKIEDIAYSLLGLLDVYLSPNYGEGKRAFARLQETLLTSPAFDESLFAWTIKKDLKCIGVTGWAPDGNRWGLLAPSPDCFEGSRGIVRHDVSPRRGDGFRWTPQGVTFEHSYKEMRNTFGVQKSEINFVLNCATQDSQRNTLGVVIQLKKISKGGDVWMREQCNSFGEGKKNPKKIDGRSLGIDQGSMAWLPLTARQPPQP